MIKVLLLLLSIVLALEISPVLGMANGVPAKDGEFPYVVSIRHSDNCHICTGTIISDQWILTSQGCYSFAWFGYVRFGSNALENNCEAADDLQVKIVDVIPNPWGFDLKPYHHDMVLIRLNSSIPLGDNVKAVELPVLDEAWPDHQNATIVGFSANFNGQMQKLEVTLYDDDYCSQSGLFDGWTIPNFVVMKCGTFPKWTDYCYHDYGGPLIYGGKQYGIMSYIHGYCGTNPGVFSPVSYFRQWIKETTGV